MKSGRKIEITFYVLVALVFVGVYSQDIELWMTLTGNLLFRVLIWGLGVLAVLCLWMVGHWALRKLFPSKKESEGQTEFEVAPKQPR